MNNLRVKSFGPIAEADVTFGDLTLLVGPQASGKSLFIQLLKLLIDKKHIKKTLENYGFIWGKDTARILDFYFGEGMSSIWKDETEIAFDENIVSKNFLLSTKGRPVASTQNDELFYIPAQRILSIADGRPKNFMEFDASTPYVLKQFSETLRQLIQNGIKNTKSIFPISNRLKEPLRQSFKENIFYDGEVFMDDKTGQKRLRMQVQGMSVPFITWSAGQKEFMPLLMGFYWLCPPSKTSLKADTKYVVIEEPEMGLHPQAIASVILQIIDLMARGYKVIVSTHSPVILEFAWAFNLLKRSNVNDEALLDLFDIEKTVVTKNLFKNILKNKNINTFYFSRTNNSVFSKDITSLDAGSEDAAISEWGGLSHFSTKATNVVSKYFVNE